MTTANTTMPDTLAAGGADVLAELIADMMDRGFSAERVAGNVWRVCRVRELLSQAQLPCADEGLAGT